MPAQSLMRWSDECSIAFERVDDESRGRLLDPRHVGERDYPRFCQRGRPNRPRKALSNAVRRVGTDADDCAVVCEHSSERRIVRTHHRDDAVNACSKIDQCAQTERRTVIERREQLAAAETRRAAGGKENADERLARKSLRHSASKRNLPSLTTTRTLARSSMPL